MTPEEVAKARELLTHEDPDIQRQGLELAKSFGDYSAVFEGCSIDDEGRIQLSFGSLNNAALHLALSSVGIGPVLEGFLHSGVVDQRRITSLNLGNCGSLETVDGLAGLTNLTSLDLSWCEALENTDGLAGLTNLTSLNLSGCEALENVDALSGLTKLTSLNLSWCEALENTDGLAGLTNLTSLNLSGCEALENVDALSGLTNLISLVLNGCESLQHVDGLTGLTNLRSLDLRGCKSLQHVDGLAQLNNLTDLNLDVPEEVTKIRELLTQEDPDHQRQGLELAKSFGDYRAVFEGFISETQIEFTINLKQSIDEVETVNLRLAKWSVSEGYYSRGTWEDFLQHVQINRAGTGLDQPNLPPGTAFEIWAHVDHKRASFSMFTSHIDTLTEVLSTTPLNEIDSDDVNLNYESGEWDLDGGDLKLEWSGLGDAIDGGLDEHGAWIDAEVRDNPGISPDVKAEINIEAVHDSGYHEDFVSSFERGSIKEIEVSFADGEVMILR